MTTRAILYLRLSSSDDASTSIVRQEKDLRARAERDGWDVIEVLTDDGVSGAKTREKAEHALRLIRSGAAEVLAVWKFDRWSRQGLRAVADLLDALDDNPKALFVADRDGLDSSSQTWPLIAGVLAGVAKIERDNTATRVRSSLAALRLGGRYAGGQRPYGYVSAPNPDGDGRVLVLEPKEARVLREAASRVIEGESPYAVAHDFNRRGIVARNGGPWSPSVVRDTLAGHSIVGRALHRGQVIRDAEGLPAEVWPPILSLSEWHRVRAAVGDRARPGTGARTRAGSRLLSGVLMCGECGHRLRVQTASARGRKVIYYTCLRKGAGQDCPGVSVTAPLIENYVESRFLQVVGDSQVVERVETEGGDDVDLAEVERAITEILAAMGEDDADIGALAGTLEHLKAQRTEYRGRAITHEVTLRPTGQTFAEVWAASETAGRRGLLEANLAILSVSKGTRGRKGLDESRVTLVAQPAYPMGAVLPERFTSGTAVAQGA